MKFKKLFNQKLVSNIGFGLFSKYSQINAQFADENEPPDYENKLLEAIFFGLKKGINVIDAAQNYRNGKSEKTIGKVLSKKVFKKAIGILYREKKITIEEQGIRLK
jgi:aryl-alcohol dehydrogenase-like predicted oxidoreductase